MEGLTLPPPQHVEPSPLGVVKANIDMALDLRFLRGAMAIIIGDNKGSILAGCTNPLLAEVNAMKEAILFAYSQGIKIIL